MEYNRSRNSFWSALPPITKNLIIINFICWLADKVLGVTWGVNLSHIFGLNYIFSSTFHVWQPLTYMFMHAGFDHIFFNMFALLMFGIPLEQRWGSKRFLTYYLVTGIGAGIIQELVWFCMYGAIDAPLVTIGASGAVFGILLAFAWLFPDEKMFLLFVPIPIRSRVFVALYALCELWLGVHTPTGDNVAHFAHLGGMLFGWLLILWWRHRGVNGFGRTYHPSRLKQWWRNFCEQLKERKPKKKNRQKFHYQDPIHTNIQDETKDKEIDRILDKIKTSGYSSLTEEEKRTLFERK